MVFKTNLKVQFDSENTVEKLRELLLEKSPLSKIYALGQINEANCDALLNEIKLCAYDWRPVVRIHAYEALTFADKTKITEIIQDALRDSDKDAYKAARELFDRIKKS